MPPKLPQRTIQNKDSDGKSLALSSLRLSSFPSRVHAAHNWRYSAFAGVPELRQKATYEGGGVNGVVASRYKKRPDLVKFLPIGPVPETNRRGTVVLMTIGSDCG